MQIRFWGVRGSLPTPLSSDQLKSKISAIVQRISPADLENADSREMFIERLPEFISSTVGGNTACVEVRNNAGATFILDAGSGIRLLGKKLAKSTTKVFHIFISHFHWDHIQGLPFFDPIYNPEVEIHFYYPGDKTHEYLSAQMQSPFFPVSLENCTKKLYFHDISKIKKLTLEGTEISWQKMNHPGTSYAYSFFECGHKFIYATDTELRQEDLLQNSPDIQFFRHADVLVLDAQYTVEEAFVKANWGHSSFNLTIDFSVMRDVKNLYLFHHDPTYSDKKIDSILSSARWYLDYIGKKSKMNVYIASEGKCIEI
ncbi:MAG: MBL fold metallo-hydrolase [Treponemataceae bacterium]|nr:MBL fold metallo-hydrolase [Treponemataceae bacterium]